MPKIIIDLDEYTTLKTAGRKLDKYKIDKTVFVKKTVLFKDAESTTLTPHDSKDKALKEVIDLGNKMCLDNFKAREEINKLKNRNLIKRIFNYDN